MILRVRWILLTNGWLIELGGKWPGPDGKPALVEGKNPETGEKKMYELPAKVGPIFYVEDSSERYPDEDDPDRQIGRGEKAFYEVWAEPLSPEATFVLGGKIFTEGPCTRRLRIDADKVELAEEEWPLESAYKLSYQRVKDISDDYKEINAFDLPPEIEKVKQEAAAKMAAAQTASPAV